MQKSVEKPETGRAWLVAIIVILAGIISSAGKYKIAGTMVAVMGDLHISTGAGGWLMSICSVMGIVLALPAGGIMVKTGPKKLGLIALVCGLIGNLLGAISTAYGLLLFSRLIEGISIGLIGVVAPSIIAAWFPKEKRGLPMSIWSLWIGLGLMFVLITTNMILPSSSWHGVWWFTTILFLIITILFALIVKMPESTTLAGSSGSAPKVPLAAGFKSLSSWVLAVIMLVLGFSVGTVQTFTPTYMQQALNLSSTAANNYTTLFSVGMVISGIIIGFILNKVRNRPLVLLICTILVAIVMCFAFEFTLSSAMAFMIISGIIYQMVPASVFAITPDTASSPATVGVAMGIIIIGQNIGALFGPPWIGSVVTKGWHAAQMPMLYMAILGVAAAITFYILMQKKASQA